MSESRLVVALDLTDKDRALEIARSIGRQVFAIKINWPLVLAGSGSIIGEIARVSRVVCDFKIADIPNTNSIIAKFARDQGAWGIISHSFTGLESLRSVVEASGDTKVFSVVAMSHPGSDLINDNYRKLMDISERAGVYGYIAPGNKLSDLSEIRKRTKKTIMSPGIGSQGGRASDAIKAGADLVIVGRSIYESADPVTAAEAINEEIAKAVEQN
ncbi:orotidine-5'-phosphate decarboxylase [Thermoplasma acidophilum]|uniref:Orotidine 5'-phosphate decarboxylase n=1 Tax=Thermoplasma acidophilum (strain ATCC 25905 / DSM 1728 / JCM 9062 / NBRC 15155 / AMRC-C165) TaxID=273075 RepID=PYRF_THEAC|nr:orotidine-5'-phosphate decarboxylase [Thermoplasma acidophilum]O74110.2 RecName: Full=Orotidine 5'-phosphate decarboxylase; AltName: Full=OMP decarboxylase; Short=OMPDCase; Short=OMPdecase [Thermoplasma acidophilum DSM 1728]